MFGQRSGRAAASIATKAHELRSGGTHVVRPSWAVFLDTPATKADACDRQPDTFSHGTPDHKDLGIATAADTSGYAFHVRQVKMVTRC